MQILGLNKTTLLDYPEHVAATIFTGGCNFKCPFCHNGDLVLNPGSVTPYTEEEIFAFLRKRQGVIDGICVTGGEPSLQKDLDRFLYFVKELGYLVKLDTNGYKPDVIRSLNEANLIDYVAMDIKSSKEHYQTVSGLPSFDIIPIEESVSYLIENHLPYEFRTTVVKELHNEEDIYAIGEWIHDCPHYFLQSYKETENVIIGGFHAYKKEKLEQFISILNAYNIYTSLRGVD